MAVEHGPIITDPWGYTRTGFTLHGKVSRKAFGVSFGLLTETGGIAVSDDVNISANVEFIKMPTEASAN
jgi:polyisoprenoid-binding protein YceI